MAQLSKIDDPIKKYLSEIGRKGGMRSKRVLTREQAQAMVKAREEKRRKKKK